MRHHQPVQIVDVRRVEEYAQGHIEGVVNIPVHEALTRIDEVPPGEVWVHCASGYRASVAASVFAAHGRRVVAVDDDFAQAGAAGLPMTTD